MEPINTTERRKAFSNFLIFFLITMALVIAAIMFSIQVPFKKNEQLLKQMDAVDKERMFAQKFEINTNDLMRLFDSLNKKDVNVTLVDGKIEEKIKQMSAMIDTDSSFTDPSSSTTKDLYSNVVSNFLAYHAAKRELRDATNKDQNVSEFKQEIANLKSELNNTKQNLSLCQIQLTSKSSAQ
jgi:hypothetical protein